MCKKCSGVLWTNKQVEFLIKNYKNSTIESMIIVLNKSKNSILSKANKLNLKRNKLFLSQSIIKSNKNRTRDLNIDNLKIISLKYFSFREFREDDCSAYNKARNYGFDIICPHLIETSISLPQLILKEYLSKIFINTEMKYNNRTAIKPYELDIFIPKYNIAFEYDGFYWHKNNIDRDELKNLLCKDKNIKLYRIYTKEVKSI